ncbi:MAG: alpha/beta fold hydrolase [Verrucomicrobiae bacterium]|nr:alpha/beta fold hydrolase [Verrucomicrobiae bacterium]
MKRSHIVQQSARQRDSLTETGMENGKQNPEKPVVVLLHGMFGNAAGWRACSEHLSHRWKVMTPELPVFDLPADQSCVEGIGDHVKAMLDHHHVYRAVLGGNSLGGHIALHLALRFPDRIAGLVLTGSSGLFERGFERNVPRRPSREWLRQKIREVFYEEGHVTEALVDEVSETLSCPQRALKIIRVAKSAKRDNLQSVLHRIRCPVLLAWGADDNITPPAVAHEFKECLPRAELHFIPRCGHAPMMERPHEFNILVERFLERHFGGVPQLAPVTVHG